MRRPLLIAPSILAADSANLGAEVRAVDAAGADWIHVDVMDGHFVPNISIGPDVVKALRPHSKKLFDVHLMIAPCDPYLEAFAKAGADIITVHVEAGPHIHRVLDTIRKAGMRPGVCLNPGSPLALVEPVLKDADLLVMMCVNPGWGGQSFIDGSLERIKAARLLRDRLNPKLEIEIDGGVTAETGRKSLEQGATVLVAGNYVYTHPKGKKAAISELR